MIIQSTKVIIDKNEIKFTIGDENVVYETDINSFEEKSGVTIHNVEISKLKGYFIKLSELSSTFNCGNVIDNFALLTKKDYKNTLMIIDFDGVEEATESFFKSYTKFLLESNNKIITINMNTILAKTYSDFIISNITEEEE